jgi:hypothetical protein
MVILVWTRIKCIEIFQEQIALFEQGALQGARTSLWESTMQDQLLGFMVH